MYSIVQLIKSVFVLSSYLSPLFTILVKVYILNVWLVHTTNKVVILPLLKPFQGFVRFCTKYFEFPSLLKSIGEAN